jgi:hypothetical protein
MRASRLTFIAKLKTTLISARDNPETSSTLGLRWVSSWQFVANTQRLAARFQTKSNTLCYNFRNHEFTTESATRFAQYIGGLGRPRQCRLHSHVDLDRGNIETVLDTVSWWKPAPIPGKKPAAPRAAQIAQLFDLPPIPDEQDSTGAISGQNSNSGDREACKLDDKKQAQDMPDSWEAFEEFEEFNPMSGIKRLITIVFCFFPRRNGRIAMDADRRWEFQRMTKFQWYH